MEKRLFRNEHDKVLAGVSSGIAEYMEVDVTIIRLLFVLSTIFLMGTGILVYIIMWIVVPVNNDPAAKFSKFNEAFKEHNNPFQSPNPFGSTKSTTEGSAPFQNWTSSTVKEESFESWKKNSDFKPYQKNNETGRTVAGLFLLVIGIYFFMDEFDLIPFHFQLAKLWPLIFVAIGASFIIRAKNKSAWETWRDQNFGDSATKPASPVNNPVTTESSVDAAVNEPVVSESPVGPTSPAVPETSADQTPDVDKENDANKENNDPFTKKDL
uniref:PspC domain-containing protein n=1 Tax=Pedobacter schmidteae TaxID=2201271 RepID=UPI000EAE2586|nr:PspC domain-containing protein [Pedobacter schmidteae]